MSQAAAPTQHKGKGNSGWTVLRRGVPHRSLFRLVSVVLACGAVAVVTWLLFVTEPATLASGEANPAAKVPTFAVIVSIVVALVAGLPVLRPPRMSVNHYGIAVRPGAFRTVLLPWAHVEEVTAMTVPGRRQGDAYLLLAIDGYCGRTAGDRPRFLDQAVLREVNRATEGRVGDFDLSIRLDDFNDEPAVTLERLGKFAPEHVAVVNQLDPPEEKENDKK